MKAVIDILVLLVAVVLGWIAYSVLASRDSARDEVSVPGAIGAVVTGILVMILGFGFTAGIGFIPAGSVGIVTKNWGEPSGDIKGTGVYFVPTWAGYGVYPMQSSTIRTADVSNASGASSDLQQVSADITFNYHLNPQPQSLIAVYSNLRDTFDGLLTPITIESLKAVTAKYTAQNLIDKREQAKSELDSLLRQQLSKYGIIVDNVSLKDFKFSDQFNQAIEAKVTQEQQALQAKAKLDQVKYEADQTRAKAKAEADALAYQRYTVSPETLQLRQIEVQQAWVSKWNGVLPTVTGGGSGMFLGVPSGFVGSTEK